MVTGGGQVRWCDLKQRTVSRLPARLERQGDGLQSDFRLKDSSLTSRLREPHVQRPATAMEGVNEKRV